MNVPLVIDVDYIVDYYGLLYGLLWITMDYYKLLWDVYLHKGSKSKRHHK